MSNSFKKTLVEDKPIYYHYLDGLLDPDIGNDMGKSSQFALSNFINCPTFIKNEINFLSSLKFLFF